MLKLWFFDEYKDFIYTAGFIFDAEYEPSWVEEDIIKQMILDVDKSKVVSGQLIQSPVLGPIPPEKLSHGTKTLIMARNNLDKVYNLSQCGDNCAKWAIRIAEDRDINMRLGHHMIFDDVDEKEFRIHINKINKTIYDKEEFRQYQIQAVIDYFDRKQKEII